MESSELSREGMDQEDWFFRSKRSRRREEGREKKSQRAKDARATW